MSSLDYTRLYSPDNSFVKFTHDSGGPCSVDKLTCLPYRDESDLSFQFKVIRGWVVDQTIDDEVNSILTQQFLAKAVTDCMVDSDLSSAISDKANTYEVCRKILRIGYVHTITLGSQGLTAEFTNFSFLNSGGTYSISIANLTFADTTALATYLQGLLDANVPESEVIAYASSSTTVKFLSPDSTFVATSWTRRKFMTPPGGYVIYTDTNSGSVSQLFEFELTVGVNFEGVTISTTEGVPFSIALYNEAGVVSHCSNCFCPISDDYCFTTLLEYYCDEQDAFGFTYGYTSGGIYYPNFTNKIRLPFYLAEPQYPETSEVFRKSNGYYQKVASILEEEYKGQTDYMPKQWHKALAIALAHDVKKVTSDLANLSNQQVEASEKLSIDWLSRPSLALAMATFKVKTMPFNNYNSNLI